ncbi:Protein of unknown function [Pyronema omphalodes CBS 100304]|uniref:Uncharacterized protein n=1 Tax=Pyronema omphalodes (strain CBS 100304) TaxID=1076935 RepID=U4LVJ8_PYROM|nr:Protein of unknown function [Pyronema omphalodes CBS 100304]
MHAHHVVFSSCATGKRQERSQDELEDDKGIKVRVLKGRRLHFITGDEDAIVEAQVVVPSTTRPLVYLRREATPEPSGRAVVHLDVRRSDPIMPTPEEEEPVSDTETIKHIRVKEEPDMDVLVPAEIPCPPSPSRKSVDDDCPADDDEPKKSNFHSVVTKIGTLKKFKNVVTRCEIKVKNWRLRVEERKKAKEEKKSKKLDKNVKKSKDNHDDSDSEDEPKKMLRVSLRLKSKKAKKDVREVFRSDQDGNESDTEVEAKPKKKTIRAASPMLVETPKSTIEVEMKESAIHTDAEPDASGDETETEKTRKKVSTKDEEKEDEKTKEEQEEKDTKKEKDEKTTKKRLSVLSIESLCNIKEDEKEDKDMKKEDRDGKREKDNKDSMKEEEDDKENKDDEKKEDKIDIDEMIEDKIEDSSAASIKDIDMFDDDSANNDDTRSIKSSASSEEMDLDDNKTIRGDDDDTEVVMIADGSEEPGSESKKEDIETTDAPSKESSSTDGDDDAVETATIRESPKSDDTKKSVEETDNTSSQSKGSEEEKLKTNCQSDDDKAADSKSPFSGFRRAVLTALPPCDVITPPPTPPLGHSTSNGSSPSHWISWREGFTPTKNNQPSDDDREIWKETWTPVASSKKSLRRRLSTIFKKALEENDVPLNISRHAYRDSFCREDDEETEIDASSVYTLPLTTPPLGIELPNSFNWELENLSGHSTVDSRFLERLESFTMA